MCDQFFSYLTVYEDARRRFEPIDSLHLTLADASKTHYVLKTFIGEQANLMNGSLYRSARIIYHSVMDVEAFTAQGIKEETVEFVRSQLNRAVAHLSLYLGKPVLWKFLKDISNSSPEELLFGSPVDPEKIRAWEKDTAQGK